MYSIQMCRPGYSGKTKYIVKVKTLSDAAAFIQFSVECSHV